VNESTRYEIRLNGTQVCGWEKYTTQDQAERQAAIIRRRVTKQDLVQVFQVHSVLCDGDWEL
jgi:hypothetical protein